MKGGFDMKIDHVSAMKLEDRINRMWDKPGRGALCGRIDADYFERHPFEAVVLLLAPFVLKRPEIESTDIVRKSIDEMYMLVQGFGRNGKGRASMDDYLSPSEAERFMKLFDELYKLLDENAIRAGAEEVTDAPTPIV